MTRKVARIKIEQGECNREAMMMAIKASAQEPTTKNDSSELEKNSKKLEKETTKNDLGVDCISRAEMLKYQEYLHGKMPNEENYKLWKFIKDLPSVTPQLSVPEVTALAEWTEKLTKASEEAYNKGYADGMKAQAEPKTGRWIDTNYHQYYNDGDIETTELRCSCCNEEVEWDIALLHKPYYCENCGADMREVKE